MRETISLSVMVFKEKQLTADSYHLYDITYTFSFASKQKKNKYLYHH
jgi:hypothetical protein